MTKTLCQPDDNNICTQCNKKVPIGFFVECSEKTITPEARAKREKHLATLWLNNLLNPPRGYCAFAGEFTGTVLKATCSSATKTLDEHRCYHVDRRVWLKRKQQFAYGRCTPDGACSDVAMGIQPCERCRLYTPQLLLPWPK